MRCLFTANLTSTSAKSFVRESLTWHCSTSTGVNDPSSILFNSFLYFPQNVCSKPYTSVSAQIPCLIDIFLRRLTLSLLPTTVVTVKHPLPGLHSVMFTGTGLSNLTADEVMCKPMKDRKQWTINKRIR